MFRKPRENVTPSTGRPPSPHPPPSSPYTSSPLIPLTHTEPAVTRPTVRSSMSSKVENGIRSKPSSAGKNSSILNFFNKKSSPDAANSAFNTLFVQSRDLKANGSHTEHAPLSTPDDVATFEASKSQVNGNRSEDDLSRYNEDGTPCKRRRLSLSGSEAIDAEAHYREDAKGAGEKGCTPPPPAPEVGEAKGLINVMDSSHDPPTRRNGPFLEDSDSEDESPFQNNDEHGTVIQFPSTKLLDTSTSDVPEETSPNKTALPPALKTEETSIPEDSIFDDFEGMGDFEDEYPEGEEFLERKYYLEQRRLELEAQGFEGEVDDDFEEHEMGEEMDIKAEFDAETEIGDEEDIEALQEPQPNSNTPTCPVCNASFDGVSDQEASVHVNHCLDGNPTPLPSSASAAASASATQKNQEPEKAVAAGSSMFKRPKRAAKPGQSNPFSLAKAPATSSSAFSKLMSAHAEDAAWATAAASEHAARGKPAYQRTCPFYKILPGFNICVDAFRYGAVQGCKAYFLSHFHSDHYVGLTATWNHGPIYCSRATANLVRQQLRVDRGFVVDVEFEKPFEVPGTGGVQVTMIPANHCPGSSLFLFEKTTGTGKNPRVQRVLHCGDFRACPAHVEHPLLKPDVVDSLTGKTRNQKIDVCYLDTTYLNPRYAFPSQEDVIQACADMCVSLNKEKADPSDGWEQMKMERAGTSMVNFVRKASTTEEPDDNTHGAEQAQEDVQAPVTNGDSVLPDQKVATQSPSTSTANQDKAPRGRLLVVVGTYSIGKERICLGIARALNSKIYAPPGKQRIVACLEDAELNRLITKDPREAQVHMTPLFEIRAETLAEYMADYRSTFSRAVAFRPSGWNYRPPGSRFTESPAVSTVLFSENWKSKYSVRDLVPQRGSNSRAATYGVPYSEHSSFRELTMFCCALRIDKIIPTVNVGSAKSRERMKTWVERWNTYKKKDGLFRIASAEKAVDEDDAHDASVSAVQKTRGAWYPGKGTWDLRTTL